MALNNEDNGPPAPAYFPTSTASPLHPPKDLYARLRSLSEENGDLVKKEEFVIPPRSGKAWKVDKGCIFRLSTPEGPQVCPPSFPLLPSSKAEQRRFAV